MKAGILLLLLYCCATHNTTNHDNNKKQHDSNETQHDSDKKQHDTIKKQVAHAMDLLNKEFPVIRISMGSAENYGHQSASFEILRSLLNFGYNGNVEMIVDDLNSSRFKNLSLEFIGRNNIKFITQEGAKKEKRGLGFVGGYDLYYLNKKGPSVLNVETSLIFQPLQWPWKRLICSEKKIDPNYCKDSNSPFCEEYCFQPKALANNDLSFHYNPNPEKKFEDIAKDLKKEDQIKKTIAIVEAAQNKKINLMTGYSFRSAGEHALCKLATALRYYQKHSNSNGIVLVALNSKDPFCKDTMKDVTLQHLNKESPIVIPSQNQILVLQTDSVPQRVFRELVRQSNLPPILEGANMTNFVRLLQRPYISTLLMHTRIPKLKSQEKVYDEILHVTDQISDWIYRFNDGVDEEDTKELNNASIDEAAESIGRFIIAAMDPNSDISQYFRELGRINLLPENDMVAVGLIELEKYLSKISANDSKSSH